MELFFRLRARNGRVANDLASDTRYVINCSSLLASFSSFMAALSLTLEDAGST